MVPTLQEDATPYELGSIDVPMAPQFFLTLGLGVLLVIPRGHSSAAFFLSCCRSFLAGEFPASI